MSPRTSPDWIPEGCFFKLFVGYARCGNHWGKLRLLLWLLRLPGEKILRHNTTGARLEVSGPDYICLALILDSTFEPLSLQLALEHMRAHRGTFLDVGAHMGLYTTTVGLGTGCPVVSIEPSPATHARLIGNVNRNPGLQARLVQAGAAARTCFLTINHRSADLAAWNSVAESKEATHTTDVPGRRLEDILTELAVERVGLLKIDVEGFEIEALSGLEWDGPRRPAAILMECNPQEIEKINFLLSRDYSVKSVDHSPISGHTQNFPEGNLLFTDLRYRQP